MAGAETEFRQAQADQAWEARGGDGTIFWRFYSSSDKLEDALRKLECGRACYMSSMTLFLELDSEEPTRDGD